MIDVPADTPVTIPPVLMVATPVDTELQVPPEATSLNVVVAPAQTVVVPVIVPATGNGLTDTVVVATAVPQLFVTV